MRGILRAVVLLALVAGLSVVDRTYSCVPGRVKAPLSFRHVPGFVVGVSRGGHADDPYPGVAVVGSHRPGGTELSPTIGVNTDTGLYVRSARCRRVHARVPLTGKGLGPAVVGDGNETCYREGRILVRVRLLQDPGTRKVSLAMLAVRTHDVSRRPLAFALVTGGTVTPTARLWPSSRCRRD